MPGKNFILILSSVFLILIIPGLSSNSFGQGNNSIALIENNVSVYKICVPKKPDAQERRAAELFQEIFYKISGITIPIQKGIDRKNAIILGKDHNLGKFSSGADLKTDGFSHKNNKGNLVISGGSENGVIYGVYSFFEYHAGCRWLSSEVKIFPHHDNLVIDNINRTEIPVFNFRQNYYSHALDSLYREAHKLDTFDKEWGMWVHTFFSFLSPEDYFESNPEYFAEVNGMRTPHTQLCLSNPEVLEIVTESLGTKMRENPDALYWSVSQMDTFGFCTCENCSAIDKEEGSPSGTMIRFVNEIAREYPDKIISTLAYQYSRTPPKITEPLDNVNIMFCNIELNRSMPIAEDPTSASFRKDMEGWRELTNNIMTWDYLIQFSNLLNPFPNLHVIKPNLQYFKENNAIAHFQQGNILKGGDMNQLRAYLISKLLWDPSLNADSIKSDFLHHFYGPAAGHIDEYLTRLKNNLLKSGYNLEIFGNPAHHTSGYLSRENVNTYERIFDEAEQSVIDMPEYLFRVQSARLGIMYAKLEIGRRHFIGENGIFVKTDSSWVMKESITELLNTFTARCNERNIPRLTEWHTSPNEYKENYPRQLEYSPEKNLAQNAAVKYNIMPSPKYRSTGENALVDGLRGTKGINSFWQGWEVADMDVTVDLGKSIAPEEISTTFLHAPNSWIFAPKSVRISISEDGENFSEIYYNENSKKELTDTAIQIKKYSVKLKNKNMRYIRVEGKNIEKCITSSCKGGDTWLFCDEIIVR